MFKIYDVIICVGNNLWILLELIKLRFEIYNIIDKPSNLIEMESHGNNIERQTKTHNENACRNMPEGL